MENGLQIIFRLLKVAGSPTESEIEFSLPLQRVQLVNLLEDPITEIPLQNDHLIRLSARAQEIITLLVDFK